MQLPLETAELQAFVRTVDARSLSRASFELGVPRATLSRRLARLEERLGVRLLRRTTRVLALTDAGEAFYAHARLALDAVSQAEASVRSSDAAIRGPLRVSAPPISDPAFAELLCQFAERYPAVDLHVQFTTRLVDLQKDGFHVALRASRDLAPGLVARTLVRVPTLAVASPKYLARAGMPTEAQELKRHRCLLGFVRGEQPETHWPLLAGGKVHVEGCMASNELGLLSEAAVRGLGIAFLPHQAIQEHLARGELVHVLPDVIGMEVRVALVYPEKEFVPPQVRAFIDMVVEWAQRYWPSRTAFSLAPPLIEDSSRDVTR